MASQWYCQIETEQFGPLSSSELKQLAREHRLLAEHLVRQGDSGRWITAAQVPGLLSLAGEKNNHAAPPAPRVALPIPPVAAASLAAASLAAPARAIPVEVSIGAAPVGAIPVGVIPMGLPVAPPQANVAVVSVAPVRPINSVPAGVAIIPRARRPATANEDGEVPVKGKDNTALYMTVGLSGCLMLLIGVGAAFGLGLFNFASQKKSDVSKVAKAEQPAEDKSDAEAEAPATEEPEASADVKSNKRDAAVTKPAPATPAKGRDANKLQGKAPANESGKPSAAQEKVLRDVASSRGGWRDISSITSVTSGNLRLLVPSARLREGAASTDANDVSEGEPAPQAGTSNSRYVYVEISLSNTKGPGILSYKSWNGAGKKPEETTAVLVDSEGRVCPLVSRDKAPAAGRLQSIDLAMGETTTDVLVFEAPLGEFDHLKLALPYAAIGRTGALGFQIPRDMVALGKGSGEKPPAVASSPKSTATEGDASPAETRRIIVNNSRPSETSSVKKLADPDDPGSIKDIVERDLKKIKLQEAAQKEAERKAAEKPEP